MYKEGVLQFFNTPEGYVTPTVTPSGVEVEYVYQYKDHLGNVRLSYMNSTGVYQRILSNRFTEDLEGWLENTNANNSLENGRLKSEVQQAWSGVKHYLDGFTTTAGEVLNVKVIFDKGNTQSNVRLYLNEIDPDGNHVAYNVRTYDLQTGTSEFSYTPSTTGNSIIFRIDKDNTYTDTETYFYLDAVSLVQGELEIVEESNYYPFGLEHKGYNNIVSASGNATAQKYKFGGKEYQEELGLDWYDVSARNYDPALGRWMNLDPLAEMMRRHSPYNFAFDNPIYFIDPDGMMPFGPINPTGTAITVNKIVNRVVSFFKGLDYTDNSSSTPSVSGVSGGHNMARPNDGTPTHNVNHDDFGGTRSNGGTASKVLKGVKNVSDASQIGTEVMNSNDKSTNNGTIDSNNKDGDTTKSSDEKDQTITKTVIAKNFTASMDGTAIDSTETEVKFTGDHEKVQKQVDSTKQVSDSQRKTANFFYNGN